MAPFFHYGLSSGYFQVSLLKFTVYLAVCQNMMLEIFYLQANLTTLTCNLVFAFKIANQLLSYGMQHVLI